MLSPDVENVLSIQKNRTLREEQLKQKMLNSVKEKINNYAKFGQTNCIYKIPNFLIGEIPFKLESMHKYLIKKLKSDGFYIIDINIQFFYISWDIKDINKALEERKQEKNNKMSNTSLKNNNDLNNYSAFVNNSKKTF
jgi:hypothetical protein